MSYFDLPSLIEKMLVTDLNINSLHFSAGQPPQAMINGQVSPVDVKGLRSITPFQAEVMSLALINNDTNVTAELANSGSTSFSYGLPSQQYFQVEITQRGSYAIAMYKTQAVDKDNPKIPDWRSLNSNNSLSSERLDKVTKYWSEKRLLVCVADPILRETIEKNCSSDEFKLTIAESQSQAYDYITSNNINIVVLDPQFDESNQGGLMLLRRILTLLPPYRRQIYIVLVHEQVKTMDALMAFLNCVNLTVNSADISSLPALLQQGLNDYQEFYRAYNQVVDSKPLSEDPSLCLEIEADYPIVPIRGVVLFPFTTVRFKIGRAPSKAALKKAIESNGLVLLATQHDETNETPATDQIYHTGVIARIINSIELNDGNIKVQIDVLSRGEILSIVEGDYWQAKVCRIVDQYDVSVISQLLFQLKRYTNNHAAKIAKKGFVEELKNLSSITDPIHYIYQVIPHLDLTIEEKQDLLNHHLLVEQLTLLLELIQNKISQA